MANEQDQGDQNLNQDQQTEQNEQQEQQLLTQEQVNQIVSDRINEVQQASAAQLEQFRIAAEREIANLQSQVQSQKVNSGFDGVSDDPEPPGMTPQQKYVWDANKPQRMWQKKQAAEQEVKFQQLSAQVTLDSTVKQFFALKPANIPEAVKSKTQEFYRNAIANGTRAPAEQVVHAAYTAALSNYAEEVMLGKQKFGAVNAGQGQVKVKSPNGAVDSGSSTRIPGVGTGRIGTAKSNKTWQELKEELIAENLFPEDEWRRAAQEKGRK